MGSNKINPKDAYGVFAKDYAWLYPNTPGSGEWFAKSNKAVFSRLSRNVKILDCSCGTGLQALKLARDGWDITGADISAGMISQARKQARSEKLKIRFTVSGWTDLPKRFGPEFDLVYCWGNSIGHCRNKKELERSVRAMFEVLKPGGLLLIDSRNWEKIWLKKPEFESSSPRKRSGTVCYPFTAWTFGKSFGDPVIIEPLFVFRTGRRFKVRSHPVEYHPFRISHLLLILKRAGFTGTAVRDRNQPRYSVLARKVI